MPLYLYALITIVGLLLVVLCIVLVYVFYRRLTAHELELGQLKYKQNEREKSLEIKLQAYERLILFLERIDIPSLLMRLRTNQMTNEDLFNALMISVQKELEHNQVQQLYVSDQLWHIIIAAKDNILSAITGYYEKIDPKRNNYELAEALIEHHSAQQTKAIPTAISAVKKEIQLLL